MIYRVGETQLLWMDTLSSHHNFPLNFYTLEEPFSSKNIHVNATQTIQSNLVDGPSPLKWNLFSSLWWGFYTLICTQCFSSLEPEYHSLGTQPGWMDHFLERVCSPPRITMQMPDNTDNTDFTDKSDNTDNFLQLTNTNTS